MMAMLRWAVVSGVMWSALFVAATATHAAQNTPRCNAKEGSPGWTLAMAASKTRRATAGVVPSSFVASSFETYFCFVAPQLGHTNADVANAAMP